MPRPSLHIVFLTRWGLRRLTDFIDRGYRFSLSSIESTSYISADAIYANKLKAAVIENSPFPCARPFQESGRVWRYAIGNPGSVKDEGNGDTHRWSLGDRALLRFLSSCFQLVDVDFGEFSTYWRWSQAKQCLQDVARSRRMKYFILPFARIMSVDEDYGVLASVLIFDDQK